jgi:hypothetical protein
MKMYGERKFQIQQKLRVEKWKKQFQHHLYQVEHNQKIMKNKSEMNEKIKNTEKIIKEADEMILKIPSYKRVMPNVK